MKMKDIKIIKGILHMSSYRKLSVLIFMLSFMSFSFAQIRTAEFQIHDRGNLWETMRDDGTVGAQNPTNRLLFYPSMDWPGGQHELQNKEDQRSYMAGAGMWTGWKDASEMINFTENGPFTYVDPEGVFEPIIKKENFIGSPNYDPAQAEQTIMANWSTSGNFHVKRSSKAWSFRGLNNFIIIDYVITNQNSAAIHDTYFGFVYLLRPSFQDINTHNGWGDDMNRTDEQVAYDSSRSMISVYDDFLGTDEAYKWDLGNYWDVKKEIRTPGYAGFAMLDADAAADGRTQPANIFWTQILNNENFLTVTNSTEEALYKILNGEDKSLQTDAGTKITPFILMSFGPYDMNQGDSVKISLVEAVNGIPLEETINLEYDDLPAAQEKLPAGLDSLKNSIDRAKALFDNNYQLNSVSPPSPEIEIIPLPSSQNISLSWEPVEDSWVNPISGKSNFKEYRIYRSDRSFIGPYEKIKRYIRPGKESDRERYFDDDLGKWVYKDQNISLGVKYFYAVTSVDSVGSESWLTNRNEEPVTAASEPALNTLNVKVFPNPFRRVSGFPTQGEENSIVWTNLPAKCTIRIYTVGGEPVKKLIHDNQNCGEEVWDQLTESRQRTAPGIYFWTVDSNVGNAKGSLIIIK
jgi:hypothetical protein